MASMTDPGRAYLEWFYDGNVWKRLQYRGVRTLKLPLDMWNYQEILHEHDLHWVVETGTRHGGSALYFADLLAAGNRDGEVISIDVTHEALDPAAKHARIAYLVGDSASDAMLREVERRIPANRRHGLLLILDADHSAAHVLRELETWVPWLRPGDYLIVEDTIVNGHPVRPNFGPGPLEAVEAFLAKGAGRLVHDQAREAKFGCTFAYRGYYRVQA